MLYEMEEDVVRNLMTQLKKYFGRRMKVHTPPKYNGLSYASDNFLFIFIF